MQVSCAFIAAEKRVDEVLFAIAVSFITHAHPLFFKRLTLIGNSMAPSL
jgi:hypothetical protein